MQAEYTPAPVEVFDTVSTLTAAQAAQTFPQMLHFVYGTVCAMLAHASRALVKRLDPAHKYALLNLTVLVDESATGEEIEAARGAVLATFDKFIATERPKFSRIALSETGGNLTNGAMIVQ